MHVLRLAAAGLLAASGLAWADDATVLPPDEPTELNGIKLACTGIGDDAKSDPRWKAYSVRLEFANAAAEYVSDVVVSVAKAGGERLFEVSCASPWVLADLGAGKYEVTATFDGATKTEKFTAPATGQKRIVVRFPAGR